MNKSYEISKDKDGRQSITLSESNDDDTSKTITVKECENGYITTIKRSYYEKGEDGSKQYKWESKSYITKENPLEVKEKETTSSDIINSVSGYIQNAFNKMIL